MNITRNHYHIDSMSKASLIVKSFIIGGISIFSFMISLLATLHAGSLVGNILNPSNHTHYECVCDQPPMLTKSQAIIMGVFFFAIIISCLNYMIKKMCLSKCLYIIIMILLSVINGIVIAAGVNILYTPVSG